MSSDKSTPTSGKPNGGASAPQSPRSYAAVLRAVSIAQPIDRKDSTFTVHAFDSVLGLTPATRLEADSVQTTPRTSFLAVRAKQNVTKRTPHVSIMEENGSVHVPGVDDAAVDGVGLLPDDEEGDL
uniref:RPN2_C domain-containing protein n=1 Tax=Panagrellus redivivus TaxID=6233 RepID=A0A7E4VJ81_PANRE